MKQHNLRLLEKTKGSGAKYKIYLDRKLISNHNILKTANENYNRLFKKYKGGAK